jgi:hypothetical protein
MNQHHAHDRRQIRTCDLGVGSPMLLMCSAEDRRFWLRS